MVPKILQIHPFFAIDSMSTSLLGCITNHCESLIYNIYTNMPGPSTSLHYISIDSLMHPICSLPVSSCVFIIDWFCLHLLSDLRIFDPQSGTLTITVITDLGA